MLKFFSFSFHTELTLSAIRKMSGIVKMNLSGRRSSWSWKFVAALAFFEGLCGSVSVVMSVESCSSALASVGSGWGCKCFGGCGGWLLGSVSPGGGAISSCSVETLNLLIKSCDCSEGCYVVSRIFGCLRGNTAWPDQEVSAGRKLLSAWLKSSTWFK